MVVAGWKWVQAWHLLHVDCGRRIEAASHGPPSGHLSTVNWVQLLRAARETLQMVSAESITLKVRDVPRRAVHCMAVCGTRGQFRKIS